MRLLETAVETVSTRKMTGPIIKQSGSRTLVYDPVDSNDNDVSETEDIIDNNHDKKKIQFARHKKLIEAADLHLVARRGPQVNLFEGNVFFLGQIICTFRS